MSPEKERRMLEELTAGCRLLPGLQAMSFVMGKGSDVIDERSNVELFTLDAVTGYRRRFMIVSGDWMRRLVEMMTEPDSMARECVAFGCPIIVLPEITVPRMIEALRLYLMREDDEP